MKTINIIKLNEFTISVVFFILLALLCSCGNETKNSESQIVSDNRLKEHQEAQEEDPIVDQSSNVSQYIALESETVDSALYRSWIVDNDPVLEECAEDKSYLWKLVKIESVDYSPINDSIREKLSRITMGLTYGWRNKDDEKCYYSIVLNGCLRFTCEESKESSDYILSKSLAETSRPIFMGDISMFRTYFEMEYKKLGINVSDSINTLYLKVETIPNPVNHKWVLYHNFNDFAFVGNNKHCCIVIASKYILWFRHPDGVEYDPSLVRTKDTIDHFFEDPIVPFDAINVDITQKVLCSFDSLFSDTDMEIIENSDRHDKKYNHIIFNTYDGYKRYFGEIPNGSSAFSFTTKPKGYKLLIAMAQFGDETSNYCRLYAYNDLSKINETSSSIEIGCEEENDPFEHYGDYRRLRFKIYEDFTIQVDGNRKIDDVVTTVTRYYRIDDNGKIRELIGKKPL